jgi:hypothetical protein
MLKRFKTASAEQTKPSGPGRLQAAGCRRVSQPIILELQLPKFVRSAAIGAVPHFLAAHRPFAESV